MNITLIAIGILMTVGFGVVTQHEFNKGFVRRGMLYHASFMMTWIGLSLFTLGVVL